MTPRRRPPTWFGCAAVIAVLAGAPSAGAQQQTLDGRWVLVQRMTTAASVPVVGEVESRTTAVSLHQLVVRDGKLLGAGTLCHLDIDSGSSLVKTVVPAAFRRSLPPPLLDAELKLEGGVLELRQGTRYVVVGATPGPTHTSPLPREPRDPRVVDQDRDGKPGVTIRVEGLVSGEMHLVQRSWTRLGGRLLEDGSFGGRIEFGNEQVVLSATSPWLRDPPRARPIVDLSWFRLLRVAERATCEDALRVGRVAP